MTKPTVANSPSDSNPVNLVKPVRVLPKPVPTTRLQDPSSIDTALLHTELHSLHTRKGEEQEIREHFRKLILTHSSAIGVGFLVQEEPGQWTLTKESVTGRLPLRDDFIEKFGRCCTKTVQRNSIQIEQFLGLESVFAPICVSGVSPEVMMLLTEEGNSGKALYVLEIASAYFSLWLKETRADDSGWKLNSLAAMIDLVSQIERQDDSLHACQVVASELARYLNAEQVAVATMDTKGSLNVRALSGNSDPNKQSQTLRLIETALNETALRDEPGVWPATDRNNEHLLLGHQQLAKELQSESVFSCPLRTVDDVVIGALLMTGEKELTQGQRLPRFVQASAPRIAGAIEVVTRTERSKLQRLVKKLKEQAGTVKGRVWYGLVALMMGVMLVPVPYRVRCLCQTETTARRYSVAPFEGLVKRGYVKPGDMVTQGQLLAEMDGQSIRFELAGVVAELNQAKKKREIELSNRNVPASLLADLESQRLDARKKQLESQLEQIEIRSPLDGIVLAGSLEKTEGASVTTGKVLFEVGPLKSLRVEVAIPAEEVAHTQVGQSARVWVDGLESQSFTGTIERIRPSSELRDARNVFIAEIVVGNPDDRLRPGMKGQARIDCRARSLGWNLFHKQWNYLASRVTWW